MGGIIARGMDCWVRTGRESWLVRTGRTGRTGVLEVWKVGGKDCKADCEDWRAEAVKTGRKGGRQASGKDWRGLLETLPAHLLIMRDGGSSRSPQPGPVMHWYYPLSNTCPSRLYLLVKWEFHFPLLPMIV